jgi:hypothetical protein
MKLLPLFLLAACAHDPPMPVPGDKTQPMCIQVLPSGGFRAFHCPNPKNPEWETAYA